jgi:hypothetical protein
MTFCIMTPSITITGHAKCQDFGECCAECHSNMCQAHCVTVASVFCDDITPVKTRLKLHFNGLMKGIGRDRRGIK